MVMADDNQLHAIQKPARAPTSSLHQLRQVLRAPFAPAVCTSYGVLDLDQLAMRASDIDTDGSADAGNAYDRTAL